MSAKHDSPEGAAKFCYALADANAHGARQVSAVHTTGTWDYMQQPNGAIVIHGEPDADQHADGHVSDLTEYIAEMIGGEHDEANAARIVAAVNACAGMADPVEEVARLWALEKHGSDLVEAFAKDAENCRVQRDELLAFARFVLRGCESGNIKSKPIMDMGKRGQPSMEMLTLADMAQAAIAKVQGKNTETKEST